MLFARQFRYVYGYGVMKHAASISGRLLSTQTVKNFQVNLGPRTLSFGDIDHSILGLKG